MFDTLGSKLQESIQKLRGQAQISEENIDPALAEIRRNLLEADVSLQAVKLFTARVRKTAIGKEVTRGVDAGDQFTKIIYDALTEVLGGELEQNQVKSEENQVNKVGVLDKLKLDSKPANILLLGLQGAGKTTAAAKLALKLKEQNLKPLLVPCDLQRPAAVKQLKILAEQAGVDFLDITAEDGESYKVNSPLQLSKLAKETAASQENKALIFDTAGRLQVDNDLMAELLLLEKQVKPDEKLLVIDSLIGQEAATVAKAFNTQIGISGTVLSKLDADSRGGAALSVVEATNKPIKLASVGEKLEDLENFYPDRMASRILGMGDVISLVEKAEAKIEEEEAQRLEAELMKGNFNYDTFLTFQKMMSKLGNFSSVFKMMGMGHMLRQFGLDMGQQEEMLNQSQKKMSRYQIAISSMTKQERKQPELLATDSSAKSRKARIVKGSGLEENDIASLTTEFTRMSKMFKNLGPMLSMLKTGENNGEQDGTMQNINPMDMLGQMMGGMSKKQKNAMRKSGMIPKAAGKSNKATKIKKGTSPSVKGFRN